MNRVLIMGLLLFTSLQIHAWSLKDLWSTSDQQGQDLMNKKQYQKAKETFNRPDWIAAAAYKAEDYDSAAQLYKEFLTEDGFYNKGNALAHLKKYEQAIQAYKEALKINPKNQDALYNLKLVEDLLKKNKDQQNKDQQNKDQQNKDQQNKDQQNKDQQNKDQQNKDQQNKDQQNKDQQNKDQQNKNQSKKNNKQKNQEDQSAIEQEKQQAKQQWLKLIPDDPGGLLREKFLRDHLRRERGWYQ